MLPCPRLALFAFTLSLLSAAAPGCSGDASPTQTPTSSPSPSMSPSAVAPSPTQPAASPSPSPSASQPPATPTLTPASPTPTQAPTLPPVPLRGFGDITGTCGVIEPADLLAELPSLLRNEIDFDELVYTEDVLSDGGQILYNTENAGGSSSESEVISYEILYRCELATLLKTETQIDYDEEGSITDILVEIDALKVGVSVTRAVTGPGQEYTLEEAQRVLTKKLEGVNESSENVSDEDAWVKQILHVIAVDGDAADTMEAAYNLAEVELVGDTIVWITATYGEDSFLY